MPQSFYTRFFDDAFFGETARDIAEQLAEKGIPKSDIVIGFQPPFVRESMQHFAVA